MTIGEKIQFYRRKAGLSQEELAKRMLLSRQTVSLWEIDKTVPTLENLIRLKEIFGVSVDDLTCDDQPTEDIENEISFESVAEERKDEPDGEQEEAYELYDTSIPDNVHTYRYEADALKRIFKKLTLRNVIVIIATTVLWVFFLIGVISNSNYEIDVELILLGALSVAATYAWVVHLRTRKLWKKSIAEMIQCVYSYQIFDSYFVLNVFKNDEAKRWYKVDFSEIEAIRRVDEYLLLTVSGQLYIIKKQDLPEGSPLFDIYRNSKLKKKSKLSARKKVASITLFVLSILAIFGALVVMAILSSTVYPYVTGNAFMWVFFCFTPISIACMIFGFRNRVKKNIIVGIIITVLLCCYGSMVFIPDSVLHTDEPILRFESETGIDIPEHKAINTWVYESYDVDDKTQSSSTESFVYFDSEAAIALEETFAEDSRWMSEIPNAMIGIMPNYNAYSADNYYHLLYNVTTDEFNTVPSESGEYEFIHISYDLTSSVMHINEYQVNYLK